MVDREETRRVKTLKLSAHKFRQLATTKHLPTEIIAHLDYSKLKPRARNSVIKALQSGVYWGARGTAWVYTLTAKCYGIPAVTVSKHNAKVVNASSFLPEDTETHTWWGTHWNFEDGDQAALKELWGADRVAARLIANPWGIAQWTPFGGELHHVLNKELLEGACAKLVAHCPDRIAEAIAAVKAGDRVKVEHEPVPRRYFRRPKS